MYWMDESKRSEFRIKMDSINKDESKRKNAGNKIKQLWTTDDYSKKMKNRKHREGKKIKIVFPNGEEKIFSTMSSLELEFGFSKHLIRKYRDTQHKISIEDTNDNNSFLVNCIVESI